MSSNPSADPEAILRDEISAMTESDEEGSDISSISAKEAIALINEADSVEEVRRLAEEESQGKQRTTVMAAVGPRISELVAVEEAAKAEAAKAAEPAAEESEASLEAPDLAVAPLEETTTPLVQETQEYPLEADWSGEMGRYNEIRHVARTMHPMGGLDETVITPSKANGYIEEHFAQGFELIKVIPQGFGPDGVSILWVMGRVDEGDPAHSEIWHIQRTLTDRPGMTDGGVTGFQADQYISSFLMEGWKLFTAEPLQSGGTEIPMLWVLVR